MNIKLMEKYLAVKVEDTNTTKSGIILADTATREKPQQGVITHVGMVGDTYEGPMFEVGQVILFEKYGAIEIKVDDEVLHVIDKRDVIGILE